jgi:hypothetical protein
MVFPEKEHPLDNSSGATAAHPQSIATARGSQSPAAGGNLDVQYGGVQIRGPITAPITINAAPERPLVVVTEDDPQVIIAWTARDPENRRIADNYDEVHIRNEGGSIASNVILGDFSWPEIEWHENIEVQFIAPHAEVERKALIRHGRGLGLCSLLDAMREFVERENLTLTVVYNNTGEPQVEFTRTFSFRRGGSLGMDIIVDLGPIVPRLRAPQQER